jgi:hypothetical protein
MGLLSGALMAACGYLRQGFDGDGTVTDHGFWSYRPRYEIALRPALALSEPGSFQYRFRGLPDEALSLSLAVRPARDEQHEQLKQLETVVDLTLRRNDGAVMCRAAGPLKDWKLMWSREPSAEYWQPSCLNLRLRDREGYTLSVTVSPSDAPLSVTVVPLLSGGGWDSL